MQYNFHNNEVEEKADLHIFRFDVEKSKKLKRLEVIDTILCTIFFASILFICFFGLIIFG
jgi:hypothetical protein